MADVVTVTRAAMAARLQGGALSPALSAISSKVRSARLRNNWRGSANRTSPGRTSIKRREIPVCHENVGPSIVVEIAESRAPFHGSQRRAGDFSLGGNVTKFPAAVPIQASRLVTESRDKEVELAVMIEICKVCSHVSVVLSKRPKAGAGGN